MNLCYVMNRVGNIEDGALIEKAFNFVNEKLIDLTHENGKELIDRVLGVTNTLIDFNADTLTLVSSLLYETINNGVSVEEIEKEFGSSVAEIALGVSNFSTYDNEHLSEIIASLPEGRRILLIKLVERYYNLREVFYFPCEYKKELAKEALDVFVPTASVLGLGYIKSKLEDMSFLFLEPEAYDEIVQKLGGSPHILSDYLNRMKCSIGNLLAENGVDAQIKGRVKSVYSIYNKLSREKKWDDIHDVLALRVLVEEEEECGKVADLIDSKFELVPSRFKDYISFPKENMYQSIHMTVLGEGNRFYEIQIRTKEMNKNAETGTASHAAYKEKQLKKN